VSELGSQFTLLAIPLIAVRTLHAATWQIGALTAAASLAFLMIGLPAGVWVDRFRRRRIMIAADLGRVLVLGSVPVAYACHFLTLLQLFAVALLAGVFNVFFEVSYQSYLPSLIGTKDLLEGNAKLTGSAQVAYLSGPSIAGIAIQTAGSAVAVAIDAGSFLVSGIALSLIPTKEPEPVRQERGDPPLWQSIREGLNYVMGNPTLRAITATSTMGNLFNAVMISMEIVFLVRVVHTSPWLIGLIFSTVGFGGLLGTVVAAPLAKALGSARATIIGAFTAVGLLLVPLTSPGLGLAFFGVGYFILGVGNVVYDVNQVSYRQQLCPEHMLGRMNATIRFLISGVVPIGGLLGGLLGTTIGLRNTLWVAAIGQTLAGLWLLASPVGRLRNFPELAPHDEPAPE
jgi:MFS family permease